MPTRNINLTSHYDDFVAGSINSGRYKNASEVIRAGLRLLEEEEQEKEEKMKILKSITTQSFNSMDQCQFSTLSFDEIADNVLDSYHKREKNIS